MHYDLRLEWGGVLRSWAVPKGPSSDPAEKRLAMEVEDHPVEYADFEGVIPEGNYGAGAVIVWDRGTYRPVEDFAQGFDKGKLWFELQGHKLRGAWALVRTNKRGASSKEWLLFKKPDGAAHQPPYPETSVLSGLTVEQLKRGVTPEASALKTLEALGALRRPVQGSAVRVMLAELSEKAFSSPDFWFELKFDGFRLVASREDGRVRLTYRSGLDATRVFPDLVVALGALPFRRIVLDGEVVVLDGQGKPSFQRLQKRVQLGKTEDLQRAAITHPATYFAFDLLGLDDFDLRALPLSARKSLLEKLLPKAGVVRAVEHFEGVGERLYEEGVKLGFEGIVGKRKDSPYREGRSRDWVKVRRHRVADLAVVGFTAPAGSRTGFGALHLAFFDGKGFVYAGRVGSGFSDRQLKDLRRELDARRVARPLCTGPVPTGRGHTWVEPAWVCEVRFSEWTEEGLLRQPTLVRLRDDKAPDECTPPEGLGRATLDAKAVTGPTPVPRRVAFTHLDKVFWPKERLTKGDLIEYYREISPWMLPYLEDRPVVMTRYPDGIDGKFFFQKDASAFAPEWMRIQRFWSEDSQRDVGYFVCDSVESLLYLANAASIPLHVWSSRASSPQTPDWSIIDLDPKGAPFRDVVTLAKATRVLCEDLELSSYVKTSGSSGLHVLLPLGGSCTHEQSRSLAELLCRVLVEAHPDIATVVRDTSSRGGRVYLDYLQNGHGKLLVAPFCVRPLPGAPVSMPLSWREVNTRLSPTQFTLSNAFKRMRRLDKDPLLPVLTERPRLDIALARLQERLRKPKRHKR
jgi:bifunctional non-homologous end joining protein LigD